MGSTADPMLSQETIQTLLAQIADDPQLPRDNPTVSFWQLPPHPTLSEIRSKGLPKTVDYAIIGSGITGCSIAKHLLEHHAASNQSITVFEARSLTSGATGRNGGALTSFAPSEFKMLRDALGEKEAVKISRFATRTLNKMHELGSSTPRLQEVSEVRRLRDVVAFQDEAAFEAAKESFRLFASSVPEDAEDMEILSAQELLERYNVKNAVGAIIFGCGAFWPYRLITEIWSQLYEQHKDRFSIETYTPVTGIGYNIEHDKRYPYALSTPRGTVLAKNVIHATNGYAGHLLPRLRGKIFPLRGTMSTQKSGPSFGRYGDKRAWSFINSGNYDDKTGVFETGLYYSNQNPKTDDIFLGGEKTHITELFISDDTQVNVVSKENISTVLPKFFQNAWGEGESPEVRKVWSGIMGFTADHQPLIGRLPTSITDRGQEHEKGEGEWICTACQGYGMPKCWSSGEALAKMLVGEDVSDFLPASYVVTRERLEDETRMSAEVALSSLLKM